MSYWVPSSAIIAIRGSSFNRALLSYRKMQGNRRPPVRSKTLKTKGYLTWAQATERGRAYNIYFHATSNGLFLWRRLFLPEEKKSSSPPPPHPSPMKGVESRYRGRRTLLNLLNVRIEFLIALIEVLHFHCFTSLWREHTSVSLGGKLKLLLHCKWYWKLGVKLSIKKVSSILFDHVAVPT